MESIRIEDGTWTRRIRHHKAGVWWGLVPKEWVADPRFLRGRLVLVDGPSLLVPLTELRRVISGFVARSRAAELYVNPEQGTINGQAVELQIET